MGEGPTIGSIVAVILPLRSAATFFTYLSAFFRSAVHEPLLSSVYEYSTVNTSPPFAFPPEVSQLQDDAKRKGDDLSNHVGRLQQVCLLRINVIRVADMVL